MRQKIYYYFIKNGEESELNSQLNSDIIETISYDYFNGNKSGVVIKEIDYKNTNIFLWGDTENKLRKLIKKEKEHWNDFSKTLKEDNDFHYLQFEKLSDLFNIDGKIFILNLSYQSTYP
ncbi:hypothetical protein KYI13_12485 (plasmid) [Macrococcoides bohemicum]|uniref:hypothetical protein n=1 Tax=Macrococcoides bohemicum TaxID=1903056 RepID=UPI001C5D939C|nr:hypothetical protein [Macrococcus bohemicus]QYA46103.1 hypothetical protein KYI13_12485 [Macrococcus bohemicus]